MKLQRCEDVPWGKTSNRKRIRIPLDSESLELEHQEKYFSQWPSGTLRCDFIRVWCQIWFHSRLIIRRQYKVFPSGRPVHLHLQITTVPWEHPLAPHCKQPCECPSKRIVALDGGQFNNPNLSFCLSHSLTLYISVSVRNWNKLQLNIYIYIYILYIINMSVHNHLMTATTDRMQWRNNTITHLTPTTLPLNKQLINNKSIWIYYLLI